MEISNLGLGIIKQYEGLRLEAYLCPANVWTIGYGHTHHVKKSDVVTESMAIEYLKKDVRHAQAAIRRLVKVEIDQHHFDALVSFIFNVGTGAFKNSTLLRMLNDGNFDGAEKQFIRWNKATVKGVKKVLRGLTSRRRDEAELFGNHLYDDMPQIVVAPVKKTRLTSKTNMVSVVGLGTAAASQLDVVGNALDKVTDIGNKGGDLADKLSGFTDAFSWPFVGFVAFVCIFGFIIYERNKKVTQHGL